MACFYFLKVKLKNIIKRNPSPNSTPVLTTPSPQSNNDTITTNSNSDESTTTPKPTNKSSGSVSLASPRSITELYEDKTHNSREFELDELQRATRNFSRSLKIGEGGFGSVYKGFIKPQIGKGENTIVAVKKLNPNGLQGEKQWLAEVQFLGIVEHANLVKLIGYCTRDTASGPHRLLVYEFVPNKTLDDHLFNKVYPCISWKVRLEIALGVTEALLYLHEGLEIQVIFRDFKASNVLLDNEFRPKLSDFGLAREGPTGNDTHVSTVVMGTYGYAAPDYVKTGHLTIKSDVWSFGIVLYEILTGQRSFNKNRPRHQQKLLDWIKLYPPESNRFPRIIDPRLQNRYSVRAARATAKLANWCLANHARDRPGMREVVEGLRKVMRYEELDGEVEHWVEKDEKESENKMEIDIDMDMENEKGKESARRRMVHLAKLRENAGVVAERRFPNINKVGART